MMKILILSSILIFNIVGLLSGNSIVPSSYAQNTTIENKVQIDPSPIDILKIIQDNEPLIEVEYQSNSIVVLKGDEDLLLISNGTLAPFWHAIDIVKKQGYSLEHFTESGAGSQGNPTRIYAILEK